MKASRYHISTYKESPADADTVSHRLMVRAGLIRKLGSGIYILMPMGWRVVRKVEAIVREEMDRAGAIELSMPVIQPAQLWQQTGRFDKMGAELLRIRDRHGNDFVVQPTSEEVVTDIARQEVRSYKQLPKTFYQIQTKFRDERRPRFGLMRAREFLMKDAYSFDRDAVGAQASYATMSQAYRRIFDRFGLRYRAVAADSGAIGGELSEEFQVIAATGEDAVVYCPDSGYAANMEKAEAFPPQGPRPAPTLPLTKVSTPGRTACEQVAEFLGVPLARTVKTMVLATECDGTDPSGGDKANQVSACPAAQGVEEPEIRLWIVLLRGDHEMNEVKVRHLDGLASFRLATAGEIEAVFGCPPGYLGPLLPAQRAGVRVIADREVAVLADWVCGANEEGFHYTGVQWGRDVPEPDLVADLRNVVEGDPSPDGKGTLCIERGIEVGHVFYLGTKYSQAMGATFLDVDGKPRCMEMGCYGIGITRIPAAAIEQNHDERGIVWPDALAPFTVAICPVQADRSPEVAAAAESLYTALLEQGIDVILDDRNERPGVMFADWELIGVPHRVTVGTRTLQQGKVEYQHRRDGSPTLVAREKIVAFLQDRLHRHA